MKRIIYLDIIKGFAILLVVLVHVLQRMINDFNDTFYASFLIVLTLPIIFFISGCTHSLKTPFKIKHLPYESLKHAFNYFWPFFTFIVLRILIYQQWDNLKDAFDTLMQTPVSGLWVLWLLSFISVLTDIGLCISSYIPKSKNIIVSSILILGLFILVVLRANFVIVSDYSIGFDYFMIYTPIYILGFVIFPTIQKINLSRFVSLLLIFTNLLLIITCVNEYPIYGLVTYFEYYNVVYVINIFPLLMYMGIINLIKSKKVKILPTLGKYSLEIYYVHLMILKAFIFINLNNLILNILTFIGLFLLSILGSLLIVLLSYYIPFIHALIFGRSYSKYKFEKCIFSKIKKLLIFEN